MHLVAILVTLLSIARCLSAGDPYKILGLRRGASLDEVSRAFRRTSAKHHPDRHVNAPEEKQRREAEKFAEVQKAKETIELQQQGRPQVWTQDALEVSMRSWPRIESDTTHKYLVLVMNSAQEMHIHSRYQQLFEAWSRLTTEHSVLGGRVKPGVLRASYSPRLLRHLFRHSARAPRMPCVLLVQNGKVLDHASLSAAAPASSILQDVQTMLRRRVEVQVPELRSKSDVARFMRGHAEETVLLYVHKSRVTDMSFVDWSQPTDLPADSVQRVAKASLRSSLLRHTRVPADTENALVVVPPHDLPVTVIDLPVNGEGVAELSSSVKRQLRERALLLPFFPSLTQSTASLCLSSSSSSLPRVCVVLLGQEDTLRHTALRAMRHLQHLDLQVDVRFVHSQQAELRQLAGNDAAFLLLHSDGVRLPTDWDVTRDLSDNSVAAEWLQWLQRALPALSRHTRHLQSQLPALPVESADSAVWSLPSALSFVQPVYRVVASVLGLAWSFLGFLGDVVKWVFVIVALLFVLFALCLFNSFANVRVDPRHRAGRPHAHAD